MNILETNGAHFVETPFNSFLRLRRPSDAGTHVVAELRQVFEGVRFNQAFSGNFHQRRSSRFFVGSPSRQHSQRIA